MKRPLIPACLAALCVATSAFATGEVKKPKVLQFDAATCGDILDIFAAADPKLNKDQKMVKGAQDRAFAYVAWTHGYLNGRDGINAKRYSFDQEGVTQLVGVMFKACKGNDPKLYLNADKEIR